MAQQPTEESILPLELAAKANTFGREKGLRCQLKISMKRPGLGRSVRFCRPSPLSQLLYGRVALALGPNAVQSCHGADVKTGR